MEKTMTQTDTQVKEKNKIEEILKINSKNKAKKSSQNY